MIDREIIRFHRADSQEEQDPVVAFGEHLRLLAAKVTHLAFDYKAKKAVTASVPTALDFAGANAPRYEEIHKDFSHWWRLIHPACLVSTKHRNVWEGKGGGQVLPNAALLDDDQNGKVKLANGTNLKIAEADAPGDGTVPWQSGAAPEGKNGVELVFGHGQSHPGSHNAEFGYDHQENYNDPRALYATLYAIVKIAQNANWHKKESA